MRLVYFHDVRKDYRLVMDAVTFYGKLLLYRHPVLDLEVATKDYVDKKLAKGTSHDLGDGLININTFPAFMGDIRNKKGSNVFTLIDTGKKGKHINPTFDKAGRLISGGPKLTLTNDNLKQGIPYKKLDYKSYKTLGHKDNKGYSYADFTKSPKGKYLAIYENNNILKPISIEKNIYAPTGVINEVGVEEAINKYMDYGFLERKTDGYVGLVRDPSMGDGFDDLPPTIVPEVHVRGAGGQPWKHQSDITPKGSGLSTTRNTIIGDSYRSPIGMLGHIFIDKDQFRVFNNNGNPSKGYPLATSGYFDGSQIWNNPANILPNLNSGINRRAPFVIFNRHFISVYNNSGKVKICMAAPNGNAWQGSWIIGQTLDWGDVTRVNIVVIQNKIYFISMYHKEIYYATIGTDISAMRLVKHPKGFTGLAINSKLNVNCTSFVFNDYLYVIPGHQEHFINPSSAFVNASNPNEYYRIRIYDGEFNGDWEKLTTSVPLQEAQRDAYVYNGRVYIAAGYYERDTRKIRTVAIEDMNGANNVIVTNNNFLGSELNSKPRITNPALIRFNGEVWWLNGKSTSEGKDIIPRSYFLSDGEQTAAPNVTRFYEGRSQQTNGDWHYYSTFRKSNGTLPAGDSGWLTTQAERDVFNKVPANHSSNGSNSGFPGTAPGVTSINLYRVITHANGTVTTRSVKGTSNHFVTVTRTMLNNGWGTNSRYYRKHLRIPKDGDNPNPPIEITLDKEPYPQVTVAASKGRLFVSNGYRVIALNLDGGLNNYDRYLTPYYI